MNGAQGTYASAGSLTTTYSQAWRSLRLSCDGQACWASMPARAWPECNRTCPWLCSTCRPICCFHLMVSFSVIVVFTLLTTVLQAMHPQKRLVHAQKVSSKGTRRRLKATDTPTALLAGPSGVGKTSVFSALAFNSVPSVHPSQRASESLVAVNAPSESKELEGLTRQRNALIIDTPGHARIKDRIIGEYIQQSDVVIFCLDAKEALRGGAGLGAAKEGNLIEAVDHLHQLLLQLAKSRKGTTTPPPTLLILFTRADLSPHLANVSLSSLSADESKRRAILLNRARTAVEVELGRRRGGMGYGAKRTTKVGGMGKVASGSAASSSSSVWGAIKGLFGISRAGGDGSAADGNEDDEDEELIDYVDWDVLERTMNSANSGVASSTGTSLERLDSDVVCDGRAVCAFASVGKERGWEERELDGLDDVRRILLSA